VRLTLWRNLYEAERKAFDVGKLKECLSYPRMCRLREWLFNIRDRQEELKQSTPVEIRQASHDLSNATMNAEGSMREVRRQADALTALVGRMQERNNAT
jgi:hypothetical protein